MFLQIKKPRAYEWLPFSENGIKFLWFVCFHLVFLLLQTFHTSIIACAWFPYTTLSFLQLSLTEWICITSSSFTPSTAVYDRTRPPLLFTRVHCRIFFVFIPHAILFDSLFRLLNSYSYFVVFFYCHVVVLQPLITFEAQGMKNWSRKKNKTPIQWYDRIKYENGNLPLCVVCILFKV